MAGASETPASLGLASPPPMAPALLRGADVWPFPGLSNGLAVPPHTPQEQRPHGLLLSTGALPRAQGLPSPCPPPYRERARQQRAWVVTATLLRGGSACPAPFLLIQMLLGGPRMGAPSGCPALLWALVALLSAGMAETQDGGQQSGTSQRPEMTARHLTFIPPVTVFPTMSPLNAAHGGRVCSTWGDFHYKTFDGDVFRFPGLCNYVFSAHCGSAYEDFNLQLRRGLLGSRPTITHIVLRSQGLVLEVSNSSVLINGWREELPYSRAGLLVERSSAYVKINVRLMLTFMWNGEDSALLELDPKYANQTCGLCGDFNGLRAVSEFYAHNARLSPLQFGNLQKLDGPTEQCQDPLPSPAADNCTDEEGVCRRTLLGPAFAPCHGLVDAEVYVAACTQDLCRCPSCPCATFAEYSRQCAHAGGQPQNWRGPDLCPQTCPLNTQHQECGSPCVDTCSNSERSQLCEDHCVDGCFCPPDTVLDDVTHTGCLPLRQCPCTHGGRIYDPGASFNTSCSSCTCSGGLWQCQDLPCPGTCSIQGGSHISTYDEKLYDVHGDCSYVLTKVCADSALAVLAELRKCGLTDNENCLKAVTLSLNGGDTTVQIQANGGVFVNSIYTQLPVSVAGVTVFRPSSFFILVQMGRWLQLQVQLVPLMQVFLWLDPAYRGQMCGLCGNFNQNQADDFRTVGGVVEATAAAFANTWKTQASCPNVKNSFEDPCSLSVENENYAQHWCSLLTNPAGPFSSCHSVLSPGPFHSNCMFDTCNCEKSEDCMCAALSSYVRACAARGVLLSGWRDGVCTKYASSCPKTQSYAHMVDSCQPTCRSLSQPDVSCDVAFVPVDGCICPPGTFLDDAGDCVPAEACPCYLRGTVVAPGEVVHDNGVVCSCVSGRLSCLGATEQSIGCVAPMVFLDCSNASADAPGAECVRSCHTLDVDCFSTHCVSGCVCPVGLLSDGSGGCVAKEDCPCLHNEAAYKPGEVIKVDCNTCTCRGRRWECSDRPCLGTCVAYGDGHFLTFDGERYGFEGSCEYTLAQDYCAGSAAANGTFRIVTENVPCGTTGATCSKAVKIFLGSYELILHEGTHKVLQRGLGGDLPYRVRYMGIYLTVETHSGVVVSWDRKTSVIVRLRHEYKGRVCGLCGNFDDNALNDFTTRSQSVVGDVLEFGNSWKFSPSCPDALASRDPCTANPYRKSWAQKQCSIINSATFSACRSQVDSTRYYEACVSDACACDSGGDCECFCTAVAAYAQACHEAGVCVSWRTPDICPLFCDYYNPHGECEWHYQPCGAPCLKTCRNPSGLCLMDLPGLEGCYPKCPSSKPFFNEDQMKCVAQCSGCYDEDGNYYDVGKRVPTTENCQSCDCTSSGLQCTHSPEACTCTYEGRTYAYGDVIYNTTDGLGACLIAMCRDNGTIVRRAMECPGTPSTTPFTFTSTAAPPSTTGLVPTLSTVCVWKVCHWSDWYDGGHPEPDMSGGDFETFENLRQRGYQVCLAPADIECQAQLFPGMPLEKLGQKVECSRGKGLTCLNSEQSPPLCLNYELRVLCCDYVPCGTSQPPSSQTPATSTQTTSALGTTHPTTAVPTSQTPSTKLTTATTPEGSSSAFPATTTCEPHCRWTEWFDVDYPKYEEAGGDFETYEKIRGAGGAVCEQPQDIECEAENYPGQKPEEVGQRVHCDVRFGLVCRNDEQLGLFKMCYNYRMRVLCCRYNRCSVPTSTTSPTATASPSTATAATATTATVPTATPSTATATTATVPTATTATVPTATPSTATATTATVPTATPSIVTATTATVPTATPSTVTATTATVPTATPSTVTATTATVPTATPSTVTATTATVPTATPSTVTATTATVPTATPSTVTATTATVPTATPSTVTATTATVPTATPSTVTATTATVPTATPSTVTATTATVPTATPSTVTATTATVPTATPSIVTATTATVPTATIYTGTAPTASTASSTTSTAVPTTTQSRTQVGSTVVTGPPASSATPVPALSTGLTTRVTHSSPGHTGTPPTSPPGSTGPTTPGTATSVLPTHKPSQEPTSVLTTTQTSTARPPTETALSTTGTPPTSMLPTQLTKTGTPALTMATTGASTSQGTTSCERKCQWTEWFDVDFPTSGVMGGDIETYDNIRAAGGKMCQQPEKIECRAENYPEVSIDQIGQVLSCSLETGLVCRNEDQKGPFTMCFNYNIRVYCCDDVRHCPTTATPGLQSTSVPPSSSTATGPWTSTSMTTWPQISSSMVLPTTPKPTLTGAPSTVTLVTSHILESTSVTNLPPSPVMPTTQATTHTHFLPPTTSNGTTQITELPIRPSETMTRPPVTTLSTGQATSSTGAGTRTSLSPPWPQPSTSSLGTSLGPTTTTTTSSSVTTLSSPKTHTSGTTLVPTPPGTESTACERQCAWTDWMDQSYPMPGANGGDFETYANIRAAGGTICEQPLRLECRAEELPDITLQDLGQVVECQLEVGLVCRNQDQSGQMCFNYQIRLLCCDKSHCPSMAITTSTPTSVTGPSSTATTERTSAPTSVTGPSSTATTERTSAPTSVTGPSSTATTERTSAPTSVTGPSSTATTERTSAPTSVTGPSSTATTERTSAPTSVTGPSSTATTERTSAPTSVTGPSSTATTERTSAPTSVTGPSSTATTERTSAPTSVTGPSSTATTERTSAPTSVTGPSSTATTERTSAPTSVTGPSSTATSERVSTPITVTGPSSTSTTERVSTPTSVTGPSSTATTEKTSTPTTVTGPSPTATTERTSTPTTVTGPPSKATTEGTSTLTTVTVPFSTGTTESTSTPISVTRPSSTATTERTLIPTSVTGPPSKATTEGTSTSTSVTAPFSMGSTERTSTPTSVTGPSSTATSERVSTPTSVTAPFFTATSRRTSTPTSVTGPPSKATTEGTSTPTSVTAPFSTGITERTSTPTSVTGPSSKATTEGTSTPTSVTAPSSGTTERVSTPPSGTVLSSTATSERVSTPTSVTGPSSTATTERTSTPTSVTGPSSTATSERVSTPTSVTAPFFTATSRRTSTPTSVTGPPSKATTEGTSTPTSVTAPFSTGITERTSTPTSVTGPSSKVTTEVTSTPTSVTGPSSTATSERVPTPTSVTAPSSMGTTERVSISSPSAFPGSSPMTTKPGLSIISPTGHLLTSPLSTTPGSPPTTPSWSSETSGSLMPSVVPPTSSGPTTPCLCHAFGKFFLPGDIVYNKTDGAGCPFLAICNQHCDLDRFQGTCPTSSPPGTSASVPPTTPVVGCDRTIPPRKVNESWFLEDCTVARCEGDNRIILLGPRPMKSITCVNGHLPVKVQNQSHPCDYHYECECVCSGWGGAHYETFDGTSYSFLDNCTHVLVREIQPRYGNLRILLHNRFCEAAAHCPRALSIHYQPMDIVLSTSTGAGGQEESLILLNQTRVRQSFSKNGVTVTLTGATGMRVDIPAVGVSITFNGRVFQARLSYSRFNHNTEGQCGTCTNNRRDECRRPDGTMARTCQDMARSWLVSESSGEGCGVPTGLPITTSPLSPGASTPAVQPSCPPEPLCELMLSPVFAGCHSLIPPGPYFNACVSDSCWPGRGRAVLCQSLEAYAELCRSRGVCPDWRNATHGLCDLTCPPSKVYKSCGPVQPESCDSRSQSPLSVGLAEGCFCPEGHILFNSHRDICVPECPCVGPDGLPKFPGERWVSNCQDCVCDKGAVSVQCSPVECPAPDQPQECSEAGFVAVSRPLADKPCCMETLCVCNASTCPQSPPACRPGEKLVRTQVEDDCCPTFSCSMPWSALSQGHVGATFQGVTPCHTCTCLSTDSRDPTMWCEEKACNTTCLQGFEYSTVAGQCCGECVQTACLAPDGQLVQLNETWVNSLVDNCTEYHCQARDGPPMLTPTPVVCPDVSTCKGILKKIGCCYSCVQTDACQVHANMTVLRHRGCVTQAAVRVSFCEGSCPEVSRYSMEAQAGQCRCTCCQETRTHQEVVTMQCPDGTAFQHTYTHVDECSCVPACASSSQVLEDSVSTFPLLGSTTV
nr:mucin-5B [Odocoileus virginianus texanus]